MLSRLALSAGRLAPAARGVSLRALSTSVTLASNGDLQPARPPRNSTLTGFLYDKTGVTGPWTLGIGLTALALSKEYYIINAEFVTGVVVIGMVSWMVKKVGPDVAKLLDDRSSEILYKFNEGKFAKTKNLEESITAQKSLEDMLECRHDVFEVVKENNEMRIEEEYRRRLHEVNREVKRRLDYQVEVEKVTRHHEQEHMVQWLEKAVIDSVRGQEDQSVTQCMAELKAMAAA